MELAHSVAFVHIIFCVGTFASQDNNDLLHRLEATEKLVMSLSERVNLLESREIVHITRISDLESRDKEQQKTIEELKHQLQQKQHDSVKTTFNDQQRQQQLHGSMETTENGPQQQLHDSMETTENGPQQQLHDSMETTENGPQQQLHDSMETTENGPQQHYTNISRVPSQVDTLENKQVKQHNVRSFPRIRQAAVEAPIAFFASRTGHFLNEGTNQVLIFDNVQTNVGNAYNEHIGSFTAPVDGIYVFSTTLVAYQHQNAHAAFYKNSNQLNTMYVSGTEAAFDTSSATIALTLIKGDIITIRNIDNNSSYDGFNHCSYTGFLLFELDAAPVVVG